MGLWKRLRMLRENDVMPPHSPGGRRIPVASVTMGPLHHKPHDRHVMEKQPNDRAPDAAEQTGNAQAATTGPRRGHRLLLIRKQARFPRPPHSLGRRRHTGKLEDALGNWKAIQQMAMHYSAQDERLSFVAKYVVIMACRQTSEAKAKTDPSGSWNFSWGEVPARCESFETLRNKAMKLAVDIDAAPPARKITNHLPTSIEGPPPYKAKKTATAGKSATAESSDSDSDPSSVEDSDVGEEAEIYIHEHMAICKSVTLIAGKSKAARVHMLSAEETSNTGVLNTWCGKKLNSYTAQIATGDKFIIDLQQPCRNCQQIIARYDHITVPHHRLGAPGESRPGTR